MSTPNRSNFDRDGASAKEWRAELDRFGVLSDTDVEREITAVYGYGRCGDADVQQEFRAFVAARAPGRPPAPPMRCVWSLF